MTVKDFDITIVGTGAAGLALALSLPNDIKVGIITKSKPTDGSTYYAQGGIAAVIDQTDKEIFHINDTLAAGAGLCDKEAVEFTIKNGKKAIDWLISQGVEFDEKQNQLHLTQEGGHSRRRIIHSADATGKAIHQALMKNILKKENIFLFESHFAIDLIHKNNQCKGLRVINLKTKTFFSFLSQFTVLASGGASKVFLENTNPEGNVGDGVAMAFRAGCKIANMEFNQFHPTSLYHPKGNNFLISEAVRGEGGKLLLQNKQPFMHRYHPMQELAPRDIVARAIDTELKKNNDDFVLLDISHKSKSFILNHFPTIYHFCENLNIDISQEPIPVVPAAHYSCGGIVVDHYGRTSIDGLLAIGETSYTGLHGANRMASNSLLECVVYAQSASQYLTEVVSTQRNKMTCSTNSVQIVDHHDQRFTDIIVRINKIMSKDVGIVRNKAALLAAKNKLSAIYEEIQTATHFPVNLNQIECINLWQVATLIVDSALLRKESRGLHYNSDYPFLEKEAKVNFIQNNQPFTIPLTQNNGANASKLDNPVHPQFAD